MKKAIAATLLALITLTTFSHTAFANSCTYQMKIKSYVGAPVEIQDISYKYVDDPFGSWFTIDNERYTLNSSTDVYSSEPITNVVLTCDQQGFAMGVGYYCTGTDGVSRLYGKDTGRMDGGHSNTAYIIIKECNAGLIYAKDAWPLIADADVSLERQQLPVPGGGVSECLWNSQTGTILSNSTANVDWQSDGNLVVYVNGGPIWSSNTQGNGDRLCFQGDGNLVVYKNGLPTWSTGTVNTGQTLHLQVDCNLVIHDSGNNYKWGSGATCGS